jgi:hypothetical protein
MKGSIPTPLYFSTENNNRIVQFLLGEEPKPILTGIPVSGAPSVPPHVYV